jgi:hypothetical protein
MSEFAVHFSGLGIVLRSAYGKRSSHFILPLHHPSDRLMGARDPQQAQEANNRNLADEGKAINYEGDTSAHQGCLDQIDQIGHSHTAVVKDP